MSPRTKKTIDSGPTYEAGFSELKEIVAQLESGTTSLEEAMALYARGKTLVKTCSDLLERAELRVRELTVADGQKVE